MSKIKNYIFVFLLLELLLSYAPAFAQSVQNNIITTMLNAQETEAAKIPSPARLKNIFAPLHL